MAGACVRPLPPPTPIEPDPPPGGPTCVTACENIFSLGCPDRSASCIPACENVQTSGVFTYDLACISTALDCAAVSTCMQRP
jgi:hypothetical protein